jgi:integrase/recombinase XerC
MGVTDGTYTYYRDKLSRFADSINLTHISKSAIQDFLESIPANQYGLGNRRAYHRVLRTFFKWLNVEYGFPNLMSGISAPMLTKNILPSLSSDQVNELISRSPSLRDKAIISCFVESGLRLTELTNMKAADIDWGAGTIKTLGKGRKEAYAPFGEHTRHFLGKWLEDTAPIKGVSIWGINRWGIKAMLLRLERQTGITCNPHTFRRTFASLLRKAGVDSMTIKDLGRWESIDMVQLYTRSVTFQDSMKFYRSPLT